MADKKGPQQANYVVYDLETTGLKVGKHGVCEIALLALDSITLEETDRYEAIIAPYQLKVTDDDGNEIEIDYEFDTKALEINGLTEQKIRAGKDAKEVCKDIIAFEKRNRSGSKKSKLVGHNIIKFDNPHLAFFFYCLGFDIEKVFDSNYFKDTMDMSQDMFPEATGRGEHTLARLCERFGVDKFDAHSAMPDVIANAAVFVKILKKQRGEAISLGIEQKDRLRETFKIA